MSRGAKPLSLLLATCYLLFTSPNPAWPDNVHLTIGEGWAVVRESRAVNLKEGEQELVLEDIPAEAELSSLMIRSARVPLELLDWEPLDASAPLLNQAVDASLSVPTNESAVIWRPAAGHVPQLTAGSSLALRCRIQSPASRQQFQLEVIYRVRDIRWASLYQVAVRGEQAEEKEPVSVDLFGVVRIENGTSKTFTSTRVKLVGSPGMERGTRRKDPGFLMVDRDSPLADLWRAVSKPKEPETEYEYELPQPVDVAARSSVGASFVRTIRTPADRHYVMVSEDFPLGPAEKDEPLRKVIVFRNVPANQMGRALPPGPVKVYLGSQRTHLLQEGWFDRTPANGELRVDLGLADDVRGRRSAGEKSGVVAGHSEQDFTVTVRNGRNSGILVDIDEKPPVVLEWNLVRSSKPCEQMEHRLHFSFELDAGEEETVEYRLRVRQPSL